MTNHETKQSYIFTFQEVIGANAKTKTIITSPPNRVFKIQYGIFYCESAIFSIRFDGLKHIIESPINLFNSSISPNELRFFPNLICYSDGNSGITITNLTNAEATINGCLVGWVEPI